MLSSADTSIRSLRVIDVVATKITGRSPSIVTVLRNSIDAAWITITSGPPRSCVVVRITGETVNGGEIVPLVESIVVGVLIVSVSGLVSLASSAGVRWIT